MNELLNNSALEASVETPQLSIAPRCIRCNKILTDPISIQNGIGPECAKKTGQAPAPKKRGRVYAAIVEELLILGTFTKKELLDVVMEMFPDLNRVSVDTALIDLRNPKYTMFPGQVINRTENGKLVFAQPEA